MSFISLNFLLFSVITFILCYLIPQKYRWILILISSYVYYISWGYKYVVFILLSTVVSYLIARIIEKRQANRKQFIILGIILCSISLFIFKYLNWITKTAELAFNYIGIDINLPITALIAPVGISFYTFQVVGYLIDVYKGKIPSEKNFFIYAAFVSFFPQIVSGPISRGGDLIPQIKHGKPFDYDKATYGLKKIAIGIFKKMVVADSITPYVNEIYENVTNYAGLSLIIAAVLYSIEIYCDFSGYSDIAIGVAKMFGIDLKENFKSPYFSTSIKEFWSRWHISLSTWFRDYIYIPLGGNRRSKFRNNLNLIITFLVSGLWHGANITYLAWGFLHGLAQCIEKTFSKKKEKSTFHNIISGLAVFTFVTVAWVLFRAETIQDAMYIYTHFLDGIANPLVYLLNGLRICSNVYSRPDVLALAASIGILFVVELFSRKNDILTEIKKRKKSVKWAVYLIFVILTLLLLPVQTGDSFIYFKF